MFLLLIFMIVDVPVFVIILFKMFKIPNNRDIKYQIYTLGVKLGYTLTNIYVTGVYKRLSDSKGVVPGGGGYILQIKVDG